MSLRILMLAIALALAAGIAPAAAAEPETEAADAAVEYITSLQNVDGGFPAFGEESAAGSTIDAVFALVAAGVDPLAVTADGNSPIDYLSAEAGEYVSDPGAAAKLVLAVILVGINPLEFSEVPWLQSLAISFDHSTGQYGDDLFDHALGMFYMVAYLDQSNAPPTTEAFGYLLSMQRDDGGWEFLPGDGSDTNTTAIALQALLAAGGDPDDPAVVEGLEYLSGTQNADGGFGFLPGEDSDPNTTAFVIQALIAADEDIDAGGPWAPGGVTPLEGLLSFRNADTGAFQFFGTDSAYATYQAVPALMMAPFPALETMPDGEAPPASPTPTNSPTPASSRTPAATPTPSTMATLMPAEETPSALPSVGGGPGDGGASWWAMAALLAACTGAFVIGVAAGRSR